MRLMFTLFLAVIATLLMSSNFGAANIPLPAWWCQHPDCQTAHHILWQIRLPRSLAALLIGGALALSGAAMQGIFRNPLIDPGIIGVSSGAALAAAIYLVLIAPLLPNITTYFLPLAAFIGSWLTVLFLYRLSHRHGQLHIAILLLIGIALASLTGAATGLLIYLADDSQLRSLTFWNMGSLAGLNWTMVGLLALVISIAAPIIFLNASPLNALTLGETAASQIGYPIERCKRQLILAVALLTGASVAFAGIIGFIGLVVPHLVRLIIGNDHRQTLPANLMVGAILLSLADTFARQIVAPAELPIGILTALIGAPFLAFLVWKKGAQT
ncbi:Vitamin B12 import system permease protein BtuC [Suttonella ornithocola]|uniref:Vitamin B12 import system permease protein BtuC n=2 Tax=Suttonella ornithocola TaxID=279832 RepID=A0A380MKQ1_9GAMM|nr:Vitamin B12 import system permease protein BtuC [Suttonella ornithocola]